MIPPAVAAVAVAVGRTLGTRTTAGGESLRAAAGNHVRLPRSPSHTVRLTSPTRPLAGPASGTSSAHQHHTAAKAPETLTKKQRQNAARREAQKAAKHDAEAERQALLAKHKRELERTRMSASVENGHLVWQ